MPTSCSAHDCTNRYGMEGLLWKKIPRDKILKWAWKEKIKRQVLPKEIWLCSKHFDNECFERDLKTELLNGSDDPMYKIKDDAIPTIFSYTKKPGPRKASLRRSIISERHQLADVAEQLVSAKDNAENTSLDVLEYSNGVDACVNTDISFCPFDNVTFNSNSDEILNDSNFENVENVDEPMTDDDDNRDPDFDMNTVYSDTSDEENYEIDDDLVSNMSPESDMKLIVFFLPYYHY